MDYVRNALAYMEEVINSIKSMLISMKDILLSIASIISTIASILGFVGLRVFILLLTTTFIIWLLNIVSPSTRKSNYLISIILVLWIAVNAKMPFQYIIIKYTLIMFAPIIITKIVSLSIHLFKIAYREISTFAYKKLNRIDFNIFKRKKEFKLVEDDNISILFSTDMPTFYELEVAERLSEELKLRFMIYGGERMSLTDMDDRITFSNDLKVEQFIKSAKSKNEKAMWYWSSDFGGEEILRKLKSTKKIRQNKIVIGSGDNSFILNFLQNKWHWKILYGSNFKTILHDQSIIKNFLAGEKKISYDLSIINDFILEEDYLSKAKIVGGNLSVLVDQFNMGTQIELNRRILFFEDFSDSEKVLYRNLIRLSSYLIYNREEIKLKAIVIGKLEIGDGSKIIRVIEKFKSLLKENGLQFPIFYNNNIDFILLNSSCSIFYENNKITFNEVF